MKKKVFITGVFVVLISIISQNTTFCLPISEQKNEPVNTIESFQNMFQWGNLYLSGQPSFDALEWIKKQDVNLVINLRTDDEMQDFKQNAFDEKKIADELRLDYISIPIGGNNAYSPENLKKFNEVISKRKGKILIHCRSCGRVTHFLMGYLVKYKGYSVDEAVSIGKQLKFTFPLENLLGENISMKIK